MKRLLKWTKRLAITLITLALVAGVGGYFYTKLPKFGQLPNGERLSKIEQSVNYSNGQFHNQTPTPTLTEGYSTLGLLYDQFFNAPPIAPPVSHCHQQK